MFLLFYKTRAYRNKNEKESEESKMRNICTKIKVIAALYELVAVAGI